MPGPPYPYVLFDMDGTLVDEKSSWEWVHDHFGVDNSENVEAYLGGSFDDEAFMASDIDLWVDAHGSAVHISQVDALLEEAPLMPGAHDLLATLHEAGIQTAIVSGGIDLLADRVADELGIEHAIANALVTDPGGDLTGEGIPRVRLKDKASPSREALEHLDLPPGAGVAVGNSRYDVGMFEVAGTGVAFAPIDDAVRAAADHVVEGKDLRDVAPIVLGDEAP